MCRNSKRMAATTRMEFGKRAGNRSSLLESSRIFVRGELIILLNYRLLQSDYAPPTYLRPAKF